MKYVLISFTGYIFPIAKRLLDEGNDVLVGQVQTAEELDVSGWQGQCEQPEEKKRRLSIYDGILEKLPSTEIIKKLQWMVDRGEGTNEIFVMVDHNNLYRIAEQISRMGFRGFLPTRSDYDREKDREAAQRFVRRNYGDDLKVMDSTPLKKAQDGVGLVEGSDHLWVLKSNGNLGETIVPQTDSVELNHSQIIGALKSSGPDYEKGGYLLERKISAPIEFTPEIAFWDGEPVYSQVEIECKPIGAGDTGSDGGGAINLVVRTELDDEINQLFFPKVVFDLASRTKGLWIFDAGILFDPSTDEYYFTEFAGNRWSWGGVFSELIMASSDERSASNYFEAVASGKNPLTHRFGATVSIYNLLSDKGKPDLHEGDVPIVWDNDIANRISIYQARKKKGRLVTVGTNDRLLGYVSGYGHNAVAAADMAYSGVRGLCVKEMSYRPRFDFLSTEYVSAIQNRLQFLVERNLI